MVSRPGLNRVVIVQAAAELADSIGFERLTLSALANHLGVRTPSLYNHVEGLEGLRRELSLLGLQELDRYLQRAALGKSLHDALKSMLYAYRKFAKERPGVYEATLHASGSEDREIERASQAIVDTVFIVLEPYRLKQDDAIHVVRGFRAIGHGFAALEAVGAFGINLETDESYRRLVSTFLRGLDSP